MEKRERKKGISTGRIKFNLRRSNCCSNVVSSCATRMPRSGTSNRPYPPFFRISADSLGPIAPCGIVSSARAFFLYIFRSNYSSSKEKKIQNFNRINYNYKERSNRETILTYMYIYPFPTSVRSIWSRLLVSVPTLQKYIDPRFANWRFNLLLPMVASMLTIAFRHRSTGEKRRRRVCWTIM